MSSVLKNIYKVYPDFVEHRISMHGEHNSIKKFKTFYENDVAYCLNIETGEVTLKTKKAVERCLSSSVGRTRSRFYDIAMSNNWSWWVTFTLNKQKVDRYSYIDARKVFKNWIDYLKKRFPDVQYLFVWEEHKDGAVHFHGFLNGVTAEELKLVPDGERDGRPKFYSLSYKWGRNEFQRIENVKGAAVYLLSSYVKKGMAHSSMFKQRYYCSKNCNKPEVFQLDRKRESSFDVKVYGDMLYPSNDLFVKLKRYSFERNFICYEAFGEAEKKFLECGKIGKDVIKQRMNELFNNYRAGKGTFEGFLSMYERLRKFTLDSEPLKKAKKERRKRRDPFRDYLIEKQSAERVKAFEDRKAKNAKELFEASKLLTLRNGRVLTRCDEELPFKRGESKVFKPNWRYSLLYVTPGFTKAEQFKLDNDYRGYYLLPYDDRIDFPLGGRFVDEFGRSCVFEKIHCENGKKFSVIFYGDRKSG
jgi:hypothetical protein